MFKSLLARAREIRAAELEGESGSEGGFTLIELMVVLLIIAILLAIAIPTFLSVSGGARDRAAQSNLTNAITDAIAMYQNSQAFPTAGATYQSNEPTFNWQYNAACTPTSSGSCVSVLAVDLQASADAQGVVLGVYSANSQTCWYAVNLQQNPTVLNADTGAFDQSATSAKDTAGAQDLPGAPDTALLTTAGTYYYKVTGQSSCNANSLIGTTNNTAGVDWNTSYATAGTD